MTVRARLGDLASRFSNGSLGGGFQPLYGSALNPVEIQLHCQNGATTPLFA